MEYKFAIDVDGVLRDNLGIMVDLYNRDFHDTKTIDEVTDYRVDISFPRIMQEKKYSASQWFFQEHAKEIFTDAKSFNNVAEDIKTLQKYGKVIIVTYQKSILNKVQTLEWLEAHNIVPDGVYFTKDKTSIECDYFVDDNDWNLQGVGAKVKHGVLIDAPYNKHVNIKELTEYSRCSEITRFHTLHDFVVNFVSEQENESIKLFNRCSYEIYLRKEETNTWRLIHNIDKDIPWTTQYDRDDTLLTIDPPGGPMLGLGMFIKSNEKVYEMYRDEISWIFKTKEDDSKN